MSYKYHYTYQTKNLINSKLYIGVHSTNNLNDGYLGSGKHLKSAIKKYGPENFAIEILDYFNTPEDAYEEEGFLVDENWIKRKDTYNMVVGGGRPPVLTIDKYPRSEEWIQKIANANRGKKLSEDHKERVRQANLGKKQSKELVDKRIKRGEEHYRYGSSPSDECKAKISKTLMGKYSGEKSYTFKGYIYQVCKETYQVVGKFPTGLKAAESTGVSQSKICKCLVNERHTAGGFLWTRTPETAKEDHELNLAKSRANRKAKSRFKYYIDQICPSTGKIIKTYNGFTEVEELFPMLDYNNLRDYFNSDPISKKSGKRKLRYGYVWERRDRH